MTAGPPVVTNAGPLMALDKLNVLHLLKDLYGRIHLARSAVGEPCSEPMDRIPTSES